MQSIIFHQESWARSAEGCNIELFRKDHSSSKKPPLLFIGGVHGDEPEGVRLAQEFLVWLKQNQNLQMRSWVLIPCLNIDGYKKNQRVNGNGVDLNRNFPTEHWKVSAEKNRYFSGDAPASEPETKALIQLVQTIKPEVIFHFHSWQPCLVYTGQPGQPWAQMLTLGNSYQIKEDIGYPTPGSLGEWGWEKLKIPVVCVEEQEKIDLNFVWPHFKEGLIKILTSTI